MNCIRTQFRVRQARGLDCMLGCDLRTLRKETSSKSVTRQSSSQGGSTGTSENT